MGTFISMLVDLEKSKDPDAVINMTPSIQALLDNLPTIKVNVKSLLERYYAVLCDVERTYIARGTPVYSAPAPEVRQ